MPRKAAAAPGGAVENMPAPATAGAPIVVRRTAKASAAAPALTSGIVAPPSSPAAGPPPLLGKRKIPVAAAEEAAAVAAPAAKRAKKVPAAAAAAAAAASTGVTAAGVPRKATYRPRAKPQDAAAVDAVTGDDTPATAETTAAVSRGYDTGVADVSAVIATAGTVTPQQFVSLLRERATAAENLRRTWSRAGSLRPSSAGVDVGGKMITYGSMQADFAAQVKSLKLMARLMSKVQTMRRRRLAPAATAVSATDGAAGDRPGGAREMALQKAFFTTDRFIDYITHANCGNALAPQLHAAGVTDARALYTNGHSAPAVATMVASLGGDVAFCALAQRGEDVLAAAEGREAEVFTPATVRARASVITTFLQSTLIERRLVKAGLAQALFMLVIRASALRRSGVSKSRVQYDATMEAAFGAGTDTAWVVAGEDLMPSAQAHLDANAAAVDAVELEKRRAKYNAASMSAFARLAAHKASGAGKHSPGFIARNPANPDAEYGLLPKMVMVAVHLFRVPSWAVPPDLLARWAQFATDDAVTKSVDRALASIQSVKRVYLAVPPPGTAAAAVVAGPPAAHPGGAVAAHPPAAAAPAAPVAGPGRAPPGAAPQTGVVVPQGGPPQQRKVPQPPPPPPAPRAKQATAGGAGASRPSAAAMAAITSPPRSVF